MASYISKMRPIEAGVVTTKIYSWGMEAAKKLGLIAAVSSYTDLELSLKA